MLQTKQASMTNTQNKESAELVLDLIYAFVCRMAKELYLLIGIETPPEVLEPIAKNLFAINPNIWKNEEIILKTLAFNDYQFRNPKQLIPDDFVVTPQKLKRLQDAGEVWYNQTMLDELLLDYETKKITQLNSDIDNLKEQLRIQELKWIKEPETETKIGWKPYTERMHEIEEENIKLSDICRKQEIYITKLQEKTERLINKLQITRNPLDNNEKSVENMQEDKPGEVEIIENKTEILENTTNI